jgi:hypothetical protein
MNPFEMVVLIIAIVTVGSIIKSRVNARHGIVRDAYGNQRVAADPEAALLRDEVRILKDRIAVLERLATDTNRAVDLDREIEKLRR